MSGVVRAGVAYNSDDEAELAQQIPASYLDRASDAGHIAEAVIASDWLAAHDRRIRLEERTRAGAIVERLLTRMVERDGALGPGRYSDPADYREIADTILADDAPTETAGDDQPPE